MLKKQKWLDGKAIPDRRSGMGKDSGAQRRGTSRGSQSWLERGMSVVGSGQMEAGHVGRSQITKGIVSDASSSCP